MSSLLLSSSESLLQLGIIVAPTIVGLAAASAIITLLRNNPVSLVSPVGVLSATVLLYFGVGALVPVFADYPTTAHIHALYDFTDAELMGVHGITGLGVFVVSSVAFLSLRARPSANIVVGQRIVVPEFRRAVILFFAIGMLVAATLSIPDAIGLFKTTTPAAVVQLGRLATFSVVLMGFGLSRRILARRTFLPLYLIAVCVLLIGAFLSLSKFDIFGQAVAAVGGILLANPSRRAVLICTVVGCASFVVLTPLILVARQLSSLGGLSLADRVSAGRQAIQAGSDFLSLDDAPNLVLSRIQYVNGMAWARNEYISGRPGTSVTADAFWVFIPRAIWPDKPILSNTGRYITELTTNVETASSTGITIFGEAFWNAGYPGVIVVSSIVGLILGWLTVRSLDALTRMDGIGMIWVWAGAYMAFRIDGFLMTDYIGQLVIQVITYKVVQFVLRSFPTAKRDLLRRHWEDGTDGMTAAGPA